MPKKEEEEDERGAVKIIGGATVPTRAAVRARTADKDSRSAVIKADSATNRCNWQRLQRAPMNENRPQRP